MAKCLACLAIPETIHICSRFQHSFNSRCARRALASLNATSCTRYWSWGTRLLLFKSPTTQSPDTAATPYSIYKTFINSLHPLLRYIKFADKGMVKSFEFRVSSRSCCVGAPTSCHKQSQHSPTIFVFVCFLYMGP